MPAAPIPIWIGCQVQEKLLRRVARLADGWMPIVDPVPHLEELRGYVAEAGRDPDAVARGGPPDGRRRAGGVGRGGSAAGRRRCQRSDDLRPPGASPQEGLAAMLAAREAIIGA